MQPAEFKTEEESDKAIIKAIGGLEKWSHQCHAASLAVVRTGLLGKGARVARGFHPATVHQHSWAVIGDPYDPNVSIVDVTLWSYTRKKPEILRGIAKDLPHKPHGAGNIFEHGRPDKATGKIIILEGLSKNAQFFLKLAAPGGLDIQGWHFLANAPVGGWPAREIISKMAEDERLRPLISIDRIGMLTNLNPKGLYW